MDTNVVLPMDARSPHLCKVVFDYFLDPALLAQQQLQQQAGEEQQRREHAEDVPGSSTLQALWPQSAQGAAAAWCSGVGDFVAESLAASDKVQQEDIALCEAVQRGLEDDAYGVGRYAPGVEAPMHHFHRLLYAAVMRADLASKP